MVNPTWSSNFNPTPQEMWTTSKKKNFISEYTQSYNELESKGINCILLAWMSAITGIALSIFSATAYAATGPISIPLTVISWLSIVAIGTTASIVGSFWIGQKNRIYENQQGILNTTMTYDYEEKI